MKKTIFALAALAALAMGCVKEQQPSDTPADQGKVTTIRVTVAQTKVAVDETTGACTWQDGDQLAVWYQNNEDNTAGKKVIFTYKGLLEDGSAEFTTTEDVAGYTAVRAAHPVSSVTETGFSLTRDWTYDAEKRPLYVRTESITTNPDGSLSAQLGHNASLLKFTLHDIPAYAAGFVLETKRYNEDGSFKDKIDITTSFPYKTGYTADPDDNSNDIDLYSIAPHSSYLLRIYLIDGDGDEIEGSEKKFKQSGNDVSNDDFIALPRVDFQKANLRKDYVKVCGIKWAKGNLVFDLNGAWQVAQSGIDDAFQTGWGLHDEQWKYINWDGTKNTASGKYTNANEWFDHFNYGGIGRRSKFGSMCILPSVAKFSIAGKVYKGADGDVAGEDPSTLDVLTGEAQFTNVEANITSSNVTIDGKELCGDIAYWASKGKYCLPTSGHLSDLSHKSSSKASFQFGHYKPTGSDVVVYGVLYTTPVSQGEVTRNYNDVEFTEADLESGLFLPKAGRRGPKKGHSTTVNSGDIVEQGTLGVYRCGTFGSFAAAYPNAKQNTTVLELNGNNEVGYGYTFTADSYNIYSSGDRIEVIDHKYSVRAGLSIRPVLVEE